MTSADIWRVVPDTFIWSVILAVVDQEQLHGVVHLIHLHFANKYCASFHIFAPAAHNSDQCNIVYKALSVTVNDEA